MTRPGLAAGVLGFALGGFFDGIMLHQVLQWHHFLSLVPGEALRNIEAQILADGMFHVAVYLITAIGLWLLWRARGGLAPSGAGRGVLSATLLGFAVWQLVDVVVFHWIIGIHRIRVDVPNPLAWDIGWIVVVGLPPLAAGLWLARTAPPPSRGGMGGGAVAASLAVLCIGSASLASLPPPGVTTALVLFRPGISPDAAFAAAIAAGGRVAWSAPSGSLLAVDLGEDGSTWELLRGGALLVGRSPLTGGCLGWTRLRV